MDKSTSPAGQCLVMELTQELESELVGNRRRVTHLHQLNLSCI